MTRLPAVTARRLIAALLRLGYVIDRQRGSHVVLRHPTLRRQTTIPNHPGDLKRPLLFKILRDLDMAPDDFAGHL